MTATRVAFFALFLLQAGCSHVFYQPDRKLHYPPEKNNVAYESMFFDSADGTRLSAWWLPSQMNGTPKKEPALGTVVQFHGNAQNISAHYASLVWLTQKGYNQFIGDYRGYGQSEGKPDQEGVYHDALAALNKGYQLHKASKAKSFIVYGQSLGGIIGLRALADFEHLDKVDLIVMDSTFTSYQRIARRKIQKSWVTWIFFPLAYLLVSDGYASEDVMDKIKNRLLVIHAVDDPIVEYINGEELYEEYTGPKELWKLPSRSHTAVFVVDPVKNRKRFLKVLQSLGT